ncbi:MAG TPA: tetratricopeptide repeat protein [Deinococcales bacterium]|nr:tetratricopeptide repeat protein [Deinococcales bacterium]
MKLHCTIIAGAALAALALPGSAAAQRVGFPPLAGSDETLSLAVPTAVTRVLESVDGVSAPSPADLAVYLAQGQSAAQKLVGDYGLDFLVRGTLSGQAGAYTLALEVAGPSGTQKTEAKGANFAALVKAADAALIRTMALKASPADLQEVAAVENGLPVADVAYAAARGHSSGLNTLEAAGENAWALSVRAAFAAAGGQNTVAIALADRAARLAPQDVNVQTAASAAALVAGQFDLARGSANTALKLNPAKPEAHYLLGAVMLRSAKQVTRAELVAAGNEFGRALQVNPRFLDAGLDLATVLQQLAMLENRKDYLNVALQYVGPLVSRFVDEPRLHAKVIELFEANNQTADAADYLLRLVRAHPGVQPAVYSLAVGLSDGEVASRIVTLGEQQYTASAEIAGARGRLLEREGKYAEAAAAYAESLARGGDPVATYASLAVAHAKAGKVQEARNAIDRAGGGPAAPLTVARVFLAAGLTKEAGDAIRTLAATDAEASYLLGAVSLRDGNFAEADRLFDATLRLSANHAGARVGKERVSEMRGVGTPTLSARDAQLYRIALAARDMGEYQEALNTLAALAKSNAKSPQVNLMLGIVRSELTDHEGAVRALEAASAAAPKNAVILTRLGAAYNGIGRFDLAKEALDAAKLADPKYGRPYFELGLIYYGSQLPEQAIANFRKAMELDPSLAPVITPILAQLGAK